MSDTHNNMRDFKVEWVIDEFAESPRKAAEKVWREVFERDEILPDDACVFDVTDSRTGLKTTIDLSEPA